MYTVRVEFTSPEGKWLPVLSWLVRFIERTPYSHVRLGWTSTSGEPLIYEASGSSVKLIGRYAATNYKVTIHESYEFTLDTDQYRQLIKLFRFAAVRYGTLQILGIALSRLLRRKTNLFSRGPKQQVCSELVAYFLRDVIGMPFQDEDFDLIGPRGIKEKLDELCTFAVHFNALNLSKDGEHKDGNPAKYN